MNSNLRALRLAAVLMIALAGAPLPSVAADGGHGGMGGGRGGMGGSGGPHGGGVFHVRGGSGIGRAGLAAPAGRTEAADGIGGQGVARDAGPTRGIEGPRGGAGPERTSAGQRGSLPLRSRSRLALRRLFARQRRLETSRCNRTLAERYHAPHSCNGARRF